MVSNEGMSQIRDEVLSNKKTVPIANTIMSPFILQEKKELKLNPNEKTKHVMYMIKEFLLNNEYVEVSCCTSSSPASIRASESLVRLGYVYYERVKTDTTVLNGKRRTKLIVKLRRTENFKALYDENEEIRKKTQEIDSTF